MRRCLFVFVAIVILLFVFICVQGEQTVWDCPGCGRTGNTKNYCRTCGHPAPWIESEKNEQEIVNKSLSHGMKRYVAAGDDFTVAITEDGRCVSTMLAPDVSKWEKMMFICADGKNVAGIKRDGTVLCTDVSLEVDNWKDITMIDYNSSHYDYESGRHIVGLRKDGRVLAAGANRYGECNVSRWESIVDISVGFSHTVGLRADGSVIAVGDNTYGQCNTGNWTEIVDVAAAKYSTYGLKSNGEIVSTGARNKGYGSGKTTPVESIDWKDTVAITAFHGLRGDDNDYIIGLKMDGSITINSIDSESFKHTGGVESFSNVVSLDCSYGYIVCINAEGKASQIGNTDNRYISRWKHLKTKDITPETASRLKEFKTVGNTVRFGAYEQDNDYSNGSEEIEWTVLEVQDDKALLISNYALNVLQYAKNWRNEPITWEDCYLRRWLNHSFLNSAFSKDEQAAILVTDVNNTGQGYGDWNTNGGNNTQDRIFLLSYTEANRYFGIQLQNFSVPESYNNMKARVKPTTYAIMQGASTSSFNKTVDDMASGWWWLRSPGMASCKAASVHYDGSLGSRHVSDHGGCVRPAFWINLESDIF